MDDVRELMQGLPFVEHLGIEMVSVGDGRAVGRLTLSPEHSSNPERTVAHGGVTYALADTVGGAAAVERVGTVTPTVDMRMDYLAPATDDLRAEAELLRVGGSVAVADVEVTLPDGTRVATARGVYKSGGDAGDSPWTAGGTRWGGRGSAVEDVEGGAGDAAGPGDTAPGSDRD